MSGNEFAWGALCARVGGAWELARRVCVDASVCVWVACVHDSLDTGPNVWESHSCWGGLGAGSPRCYSSCQLWFPSPLISPAPLPSPPLMPSQCFPFRLLLCFPSITPDGSMRRETNRGEARAMRTARGGCVGRQLGIFLFSRCLAVTLVFPTQRLTIGTKLPSARSDLHVFKCL